MEEEEEEEVEEEEEEGEAEKEKRRKRRRKERQITGRRGGGRGGKRRRGGGSGGGRRGREGETMKLILTKQVPCLLTLYFWTENPHCGINNIIITHHFVSRSNCFLCFGADSLRSCHE